MKRRYFELKGTRLITLQCQKSGRARSVANCKTYPVANCDSDHQLLVMTMKVKIEREKDRSQPKRLNLQELKDAKAKQYAVEVIQIGLMH